MKKLSLVRLGLVTCHLSLVTLFPGCSTFDKTVASAAKTDVGARVIARSGNSVVDKGLETSADYAYAVAAGLRANEGKILTKELVQKIATHYGDPNNQHKFKQLGADLWDAIKSAGGQIADSIKAELAARGLEQGAQAAAGP